MQLNVATEHLTHVLVTPATDATVFVIDDDISVRESLDELIRAKGWRPETFASSEEFLAFPPHLGPCCMVLDVMLPGLSSLELQAKLIALSAMPVIFVSGNADIPTTAGNEDRRSRISDEAASNSGAGECEKKQFWIDLAGGP